jgi:hypothetical protein
LKTDTDLKSLPSFRNGNLELLSSSIKFARTKSPVEIGVRVSLYDLLVFYLVLLLAIFRRAPHPSDTRGRPCALLLSLKKQFMIRGAPSGSHLKCLKSVKTYGKTFY